MTKAQKIADYDRVARERDTFMLALNDVLNQDFEFSSWCKESDSQGEYRVGVSRLNSAGGGVMVVTFRHPGQSDYTITQNIVDSKYPMGFYTNPALSEAIREAYDVWHDAREVKPAYSAAIRANAPAYVDPDGNPHYV